MGLVRIDVGDDVAVAGLRGRDAVIGARAGKDRFVPAVARAAVEDVGRAGIRGALAGRVLADVIIKVIDIGIAAVLTGECIVELRAGDELVQPVVEP